MAPDHALLPPLIAADVVPDAIDLLVLFGSRAKGQASEASDWDLAVLLHPNKDEPLRIFALDPVLANLLGCSSDAIDVVDLDHSSYLLQRVVAEEGALLFERRPGLFLNFTSRAIRQWADWCRREDKLQRERLMAQA